jgi:CRISPR-associated protein Csx10
MTEYFLCLTPEKPLRTGTVKPRGDYLDTREYLPGSVLRGALAEWLKLQGRAHDILPLVQKVRFGNFFPTPSERVWSLPFPMTALECKLHVGFRQVPKCSKEKPGHGIRDSLLIALVYAELERLGARFPVPMLLRCTHEEKGEKCGGRMERVSGFYVALPEGWQSVKTEKGLQTKVALSRYRRAAQEGMLYRVVGVRPKGHFVGRLWAEDDSVVEELKQAVAHVGVGALTTRGFGTAKLKEAEPAVTPLRERLHTFNEKLREVWRDMVALARQVDSSVALPPEPSGTYFSVDLLVPAILRDPTVYPRSSSDSTSMDTGWSPFSGQRNRPSSVAFPQHGDCQNLRILLRQQAVCMCSGWTSRLTIQRFFPGLNPWKPRAWVSAPTKGWAKSSSVIRSTRR